MEAKSSINPLVRANFEQPDPEVRQLIVDHEQPEYDGILTEIEAAGFALNSLLGMIPDAQARMMKARQAQSNFFERQWNGSH